jgi:hypothetical protein
MSKECFARCGFVGLISGEIADAQLGGVELAMLRNCLQTAVDAANNGDLRQANLVLTGQDRPELAGVVPSPGHMAETDQRLAAIEALYARHQAAQANTLAVLGEQVERATAECSEPEERQVPGAAPGQTASYCTWPPAQQYEDRYL